MKYIFTVFIIILTACSGLEPEDLDYYNPIVLTMPGITTEMETSGYWITKISNPDRIIATSEEIQLLNQETGLNHNILNMSEYDTVRSRDIIEKSINTLYSAAANRVLYLEDMTLVTKKQLDKIDELIQIDNISEYEPVLHGIIVKRISQKIIPTEQNFYRKGNGYFDRLQMSSLDVGTPVAVLWKTIDKKWLYVRSSLTVGWVPSETVALCTFDEMKYWSTVQDFAIAVKYRVSLYGNREFTEYGGWMPLGAKLPLADKIRKDKKIALLYPYKDIDGWLSVKTVYAHESDISIGYVPYTSRNMINMAFELLHAPYGWGGMNEDQDCSGYMIQLFNAVGIELPRNSGQQGTTGKSIYTAGSKIEAGNALKMSGIPGATTIHFPGHIMLYLGEDVDGPYTIHSMWAYEELKDRPVLKIPGRVVVSNLKLSAHTKSGSYLERARNIRVLKK